MAKDSIRTYSSTAASNTDVGGVGIQGTDPASNMDDGLREIMSHLAETNAGTSPVDDTWSFCDPADATKRVRLDAGNVTAGQTRVVTLSDGNVTLPSGTVASLTGTETLTNKTLTSPTINGGTFTGGTDITVADGGTGRSSHTAYAVLCGGTTTTAAQQSIASVGTSGQVLTSNGAGALPTFQTLSIDYGAGNAALSAGAVGTYAFAGANIGASSYTAGTTYAGSGLQFAGVHGNGGAPGAALSGTWRAMGTIDSGGGGEAEITLFLRIS